MDDVIKIAVLAGTTRSDRKSIHAAHWIADFGRTLERVEITFVDPVDFTFPGDGNDPQGKDPRYTIITDQADAFFIVTPEYNHSFPGSLKRMLDSELENYVHKAVAFAGCSSGNWGGIRAIEALVVTIREMGLSATFSDVAFPRVQAIFDDKGSMQLEYEARYTKSVAAAYTELIWMATALKTARLNGKD
jgi:NAD(P)H-dependent FMN reductase